MGKCSSDTTYSVRTKGLKDQGQGEVIVEKESD